MDLYSIVPVSDRTKAVAWLAALLGRPADSAELAAGGDQHVGTRLIEQACQRAGTTLVNVLRRYPPAPDSRNRVGHLMKTLDTALRSI